MLSTIENIISQVNSFAWGPITMILLVGTALYLSIITKFIQYRKIAKSTKLLISKGDNDGDITPFQALATSLSATIGTGNIVGVATAITLGGPGAVFWMWITAIFGGATKFAEAFLAVTYRVTNSHGEKSGGPMYYIEKGFKENYNINMKWLAIAFSIFGFFASFGIGNLVQVNSIANAVNTSFHIPPYITGIILAILVASVILGGIKSIAKVTEILIPLMAAFYILAAIIVLLINSSYLLNAFSMIFSNAFSAHAISGSLVGSVIRYGVARGVFSNEAGLGSAPISHAASSNTPVKQGLIASLGCTIDTLIICTMTALVILSSPLISFNSQNMFTVQDDLSGAQLTIAAFNSAIPSLGSIILTIGLIFFAFSTVLGWFYYGSKCLEYLFGTKAIIYYKIFFILSSFIGCVSSIKIVWDLSDTFNGLMAIPNLIALLALSPLIIKSIKNKDENKN